MIHERFDIPDADGETIMKAEQFLREAVEALGGDVRKRNSRGCNQCPGFEAVFYLPEPEGDEMNQDDLELCHEYATLYHRLDEVHERYTTEFGAYL